MDVADIFGEGFGSNAEDLSRRAACVTCPTQAPVCGDCAPGHTCVQRLPRGCWECTVTKCVPNAQSGAQPYGPPPSSGPNIGAIVGGIIGGLVFIAVATWLIWHFFIKARREQWEDEAEYDFEPYPEKGVPTGYMPSPNPDRTQSVHTRQSVASTAYTRGSNVIQIAFIPGVTGRSEEEAGFIPPVPPIPAAQSHPQSPQTPYRDYTEDHYFMPGDLRDSAYSGFTDDGASTIRQSVAASIAPSLLRQSVASTIYGGNVAENPMPAQTAQRGRPLMVSVKSSTNTSRSGSIATPVVPRINTGQFGQNQPSPGAGQTSSAPPTIAIKNSMASFDTTGSGAQTPKLASPPATAPPVQARKESLAVPRGQSAQVDRSSLVAAIEEAARQASRQPLHGGLGAVRRDPSPFSDEHGIPSSGSSTGP